MSTEPNRSNNRQQLFKKAVISVVRCGLRDCYLIEVIEKIYIQPSPYLSYCVLDRNNFIPGLDFSPTGLFPLTLGNCSATFATARLPSSIATAISSIGFDS
jgi:hypothetical protein